jgi:hypothetical protein
MEQFWILQIFFVNYQLFPHTFYNCFLFTYRTTTTFSFVPLRQRIRIFKEDQAFLAIIGKALSYYKEKRNTMGEERKGGVVAVFDWGSLGGGGGTQLCGFLYIFLFRTAED